MAIVVTFWRLPEEERAFVEYVGGTGQVVAFPFERVRDRAELAPRALDEYLADRDPDEVLLGLAEHAGLLRVDEHPDPGGTFFTPSLMQSPVIAYKRGKRRASGGLGGCNLAAYWSYTDDEAGRLIDKPADFVVWAKKVFRWTRGATPVKVSAGWRVTPAVSAAMREGLEIAP